MSFIPVIHTFSVSMLDTTLPFTRLVLKMMTRQVAFGRDEKKLSSNSMNEKNKEM